MEKNIGDLVWLDGYTSFAQQNAQENIKIRGKQYRFDPVSGEKFPIYLVRGQWYDGRNGGAYDNDDSMYYIEIE